MSGLPDWYYMTDEQLHLEQLKFNVRCAKSFSSRLCIDPDVTELPESIPWIEVLTIHAAVKLGRAFLAYAEKHRGP